MRKTYKIRAVDNLRQWFNVCEVYKLGDAIIIKDALQRNCTVTNLKYNIIECSVCEPVHAQ